MDGRARRRGRLGSVGEVREDLLGSSGLVRDHAQASLPPVLVVVGARELDHVGEGLFGALGLVLVEVECAVLRGQLEEGGGVACVAALAGVVLVEAAGVHLEDDEVLEGRVRQGGLAGDVADAAGRRREVRAEPVGDELDLDLPARGVAVEDGARLFDEGRDGVADNLLADATGGGGLADDQVDALR